MENEWSRKMSEYIDKEELERRMYHEAFEIDSDMQKWDSGCWIRYKVFENVMDGVPPADVVEVVHCKDCIYYHPSDNVEDITCEFGRRVGDGDYCSYGERKEQEHE